MPSVLVAGAVGVAAMAVELGLGAFGHGTHLLLFLLLAMFGALAFGPKSGFVVLGAGAVGSAVASLAGLGPSDTMAELALQLGLYIGLGTTGLFVLASAIDTWRRAPTAPPIASPSLGPDALTPREREVLRLAAGGMSVHGIADLLVVSPNTVKTHLSHAYSKLDVRSRSQAVRAAIHCGCLSSSDICPHRAEAVRDNIAPMGEQGHPNG